MEAWFRLKKNAFQFMCDKNHENARFKTQTNDKRRIYCWSLFFAYGNLVLKTKTGALKIIVFLFIYLILFIYFIFFIYLQYIYTHVIYIRSCTIMALITIHVPHHLMVFVLCHIKNKYPT